MATCPSSILVENEEENLFTDRISLSFGYRCQHTSVSCIPSKALIHNGLLNQSDLTFAMLSPITSFGFDCGFVARIGAFSTRTRDTHLFQHDCWPGHKVLHSVDEFCEISFSIYLHQFLVIRVFSYLSACSVSDLSESSSHNAIQVVVLIPDRSVLFFVVAPLRHCSVDTELFHDDDEFQQQLCCIRIRIDMNRGSSTVFAL